MDSAGCTCCDISSGNADLCAKHYNSASFDHSITGVYIIEGFTPLEESSSSHYSALPSYSATPGFFTQPRKSRTEMPQSRKMSQVKPRTPGASILRIVGVSTPFR